MRYFPLLHTHTMYSLLDGMYSPKEWIQFCISNGIQAMAITDHGNLHGILDFYIAVQDIKKQGHDFIPIIGCEFYYVDNLDDKENRYHLIVLAKNQQGYHNLLKLSSLSYDDKHFYKKGRLTFADLEAHKDGLIVTTACIGSIFNKYITNDKQSEAFEQLKRFKNLFGNDFYVELQFLNLDTDWNSDKKVFVKRDNIQEKTNHILYGMAKELDIKTIVTNDCHYLYKADKQLQDILIANSFAGKDGWRFSHDDYYVKSIEQIDEMRQKYHPLFTALDLELMVNNCNEIVEKCNGIEIPIGNFKLPKFNYSGHVYGTESDTAKSLVLKIVNKNRHLTPVGKEAQYAVRLKKEVELIEKYNLLDYFLIIEDILHYCRETNIPYGPSRGSVAGSLLAYYLGITSIDSIKDHCFWERFLTEERLAKGHPPDIDLDFSDDDRDKVIQYLIDKYGKGCVSKICTFGTMKIKSAIRDVTRIHTPKIAFDFEVNLTSEEMNQDIENKKRGTQTILEKKKIQKEIDLVCSKFGITPPDMKEEDYFWEMIGQDDELQEWFVVNNEIKEKVVKLLGNARQVGIHASAIAICDGQLDSIIPMFTHGRQGATERIWATQFNGTHSEQAGAIKIDILGLKTLSVIKTTLEMVNQKYGNTYHWHSLPSQDGASFCFLQNGWTETSFQYGTPGFYRLLKDLGDALLAKGIVVNNNEFGRLMVALNRPGPLDQGRDKQLIENIKYPDKIQYMHPLLKQSLYHTYGIIIYQEQVLDVCRLIGGFTLSEAEDARRAMGKKKEEIIKQLQQYQDKFVDYATTKLQPVLSKEDAVTLWEYIYSFNRYGFNRAHACGYDMLGMHTLYLITHYPLEWFTALLNKSTTEKINEIYNYITDPRFNQRYRAIKNKFRIQTIPDRIDFILPDVNKSRSTFQIVGNEIVMPLNVVKHVGKTATEIIMQNQPYNDLQDFITRAHCNVRVTSNLILAGAFKSIEPSLTIKELLHKMYNLYKINIPSIYKHLDRFTEIELRNQILEFDSVNYITLFKDLFHPHTQELDLSRHTAGMTIIVGGKITKKRKIRTKNGNDMAFLTLTNNNKSIDITVFPDQYEQFARELKLDKIIEIHGKVNFYKTKNVVLDTVKILN